MDTFSAGACIRFGWETFKKRPWFLISSYILYMIVIGGLGAMLAQIGRDGGMTGALTTLARLAIDVAGGIAVLHFFLKAHDDIEHLSLSDFTKFTPFWTYVGTAILYWAIVVCGLVLVIVPGVIWAIMFGFGLLLVVDKGMGPIEALKESKRITYGYKWQLFLLGILSILVVILGFICLIVGVLVAYPVVTIAMVHAYRTLQQKQTIPTTM
ncbi:MAG: DUF975 family protein [Candidatus Pacebacteria bacterium]|nr:DUF975 family protein [Candidatus Paceibacterota bacterium]